MRHALIEQALAHELQAAKEAADWLLDAVAMATQNRQFLRGEKEYDEVAGEAILGNAVIACLRFRNTLEKWQDDQV